MAHAPAKVAERRFALGEGDALVALHDEHDAAHVWSILRAAVNLGLPSRADGSTNPRLAGAHDPIDGHGPPYPLGEAHTESVGLLAYADGAVANGNMEGELVVEDEMPSPARATRQ
jgi:hypothetical protein